MEGVKSSKGMYMRSTFEHNLQRGKIQTIVLDILYPDGTLVKVQLEPLAANIGMLIVSDYLIERFIVPRLSEEEKEIIEEWKSEGKDWKERPTFMVFAADETKVRPEGCNCCLCKHFVKGEKSLKVLSISKPEEKVDETSSSVNDMKRGKIQTMLIDVVYPDGKSAKPEYDLEKDHIGMIVFSDHLIEKFIIPESEIGRKDIEEWESKGKDWKERPSYIVFSDSVDDYDSMSKFDPIKCQCCYYKHKTDKILS